MPLFKKIQDLLSEKGFKPIFFEPTEELGIDSAIEKHVEKIIELYAQPYVINGKQVKRVIHGIAHVSRTAFYIPVLCGLYKRYEPNFSIQNKELKLLQLAALMHDVAREQEGEDFWDLDSAAVLYYYLKKNLGVGHDKAQEFAEVIANKDYYPGACYHELQVNDEGDFYWDDHQFYTVPKTLYQRLMHDADCLDIVRARDAFDGEYLDFYKEYVQKEEQQLKEQLKLPNSLVEMGQLICEVRGLVEATGYTRRSHLVDRQQAFEDKDCYTKLCSYIKTNAHQFPIMRHMVNDAFNFTLPENLGLTYHQAQDKFVVFRGVGLPSAGIKENDRFYDVIPKEKKHLAHHANNEVSLMLRREGIDHETENGNLQRSVSILVYGSGTYSNVGFGSRTVGVEELSHVYDNGNALTGRGEKQHAEQALEARTQSLYQLLKKHAKGGVSDLSGNSHNECLQTRLNADMIIYSEDPTSSVSRVFPYNNRRLYDGVPLLEALYLQASYCLYLGQMSNSIYHEHESQVNLPIYRYSGLSNILHPISFPTEDEIIKIWTKLIKKRFDFSYPDSDHICNLGSCDLPYLKAVACYGIYQYVDPYYQNENVIHPLDFYYPSDIKDKINQRMLKALCDAQINILKTRCLKNFKYSDDLVKTLTRGILGEINITSGLPFVLQNDVDKIKKEKTHLDFISAQYDAFSILYHNGLLDAKRRSVFLKSNIVNQSNPNVGGENIFQLSVLNKRLWLGANTLLIYDEHNSFYWSHMDCPISTIDENTFIALHSQSQSKYHRIYDALLSRLAKEIALNTIENNEPKMVLVYAYALLLKSGAGTKDPSFWEFVIRLSCEYRKNHLKINEVFKDEFGLVCDAIEDAITFKSADKLLRARLYKGLNQQKNAPLHALLKASAERATSQIWSTKPRVREVENNNLLMILTAHLYDNKLSTDIHSMIETAVKASSALLWGKVKSSGYLAGETPLIHVMRALHLNPYQSNVVEMAYVAVEKSPSEAWARALYSGRTPLQILIGALLKYHENKNIINITEIVVKKADIRAWGLTSTTGQLPGQTPLFLLLRALRNNPCNINLLNIAKIVVGKAHVDVWGIASSCDKSSEETPFLELIKLFTENPSSKIITGMMQIVSKKTNSGVWKISSSGNKQSGYLPFRELFMALERKPANENLIKIARIAAEKAYPDVWSISPITDQTPGNTILRQLGLLLLRNPGNDKLIPILEIAVKKVHPDIWFNTLKAGKFSGDTPMMRLLEVLRLNVTNKKIIKTVEFVAEKIGSASWGKDIAALPGYTALKALINILKLNVRDEAIFNIVLKAVEKASPEAWDKQVGVGNLRGDTPLRVLLYLLSHHLDNDKIILIVKKVVEKASPDAWGKALSSNQFPGETPLRYLFQTLKSNPENEHIIHIATIAAEKSSPDAWGKMMTDGNLAGDTPLRELFEVVRFNTGNKDIINIAKLAVEKANGDAWGFALRADNLPGDTPLMELCEALQLKPDDNTLINLIEIVAQKAPCEAWDQGRFENPSLTPKTIFLKALHANSTNNTLRRLARELHFVTSSKNAQEKMFDGTSSNDKKTQLGSNHQVFVAKKPYPNQAFFSNHQFNADSSFEKKEQSIDSRGRLEK